jgi:hypothetical protein
MGGRHMDRDEKSKAFELLDNLRADRLTRRITLNPHQLDRLDNTPSLDPEF